MRHTITNEEKVAKKLGDLISDLRLDIEQIARYAVILNPNVAINRILLMADVIRDEKENYTSNDYF